MKQVRPAEETADHIMLLRLFVDTVNKELTTWRLIEVDGQCLHPFTAGAAATAAAVVAAVAAV